MEYLIGLVVALFGALLYTNNKKKAAEALNSILGVGKDELNIEKEQIKTEATQEAAQAALEKVEHEQAEAKKNSSDTPSNVVSFWNKK